MGNYSANAVLEALGEPMRRRITEVLGRGPLPVGRLADELPIGRPAVSKHLGVLESAGVVNHRKVGTRHLYALAPEGYAALQVWLTQTWDATLAAFAEHVSGPDQQEER